MQDSKNIVKRNEMNTFLAKPIDNNITSGEI